MNNIRNALLLSIITIANISASDHYNTLKSMLSFHITIWWNNFWYGNKEKFHEIVHGGIRNSINFDDKGKITSIQRAGPPILLGRIPQTQKDIEDIRTKLNQNEKIGVYTFNRDFERSWSGFENLQNNKNKMNIEWHRYDTTDFTSPNLIDLIRIVRDLEHRSLNGECKAYVHCKAGRGRSAAGVIAYCLYLAKEVNQIEKVSIDSIEKYVQGIRPQVKINNKEILQEFHNELKENNFDTIKSKYSQQIKLRDQEIIRTSLNEKSLMHRYKGYGALAIASTALLATGTIIALTRE